MPVQKDTPKATSACSSCRERKVKCSGGVPCANCLGHGKECFYPPSRRKRRNRDGPGDSIIENRLARMEALLQATNVAGLGDEFNDTFRYRRTPDVHSPAYTSPAFRKTDENTRSSSNAAFPSQSPMDTTTGSGMTQPPPAPSLQGTGIHGLGPLRSPPPSAPTLSTTRASVEHSNLSVADSTKGNGAPEGESIDEEEIILPPQKVNWEHHGPGSWLSLCSQPGLRWVCDITGGSDFIDSAKGLTHGWTRRLKLGKRNASVCSPRALELDEATAWRYSAAYFETSYDAVFGVIYRPAFEARLKAQFEQGSAYEDEDASWYALRNTVYASGCRSVLAKDSTISFVQAQAMAWSYFENALSVYTDILFNPTGLSAVQALTLMAFYAEGLGSPALEYMLCSNAARIAQSKGLHRQPSRSWTMPETEMLHLNWLWWAIYCCEKQIAYRSGRPSAIDDDNISCQVPAAIAPGSTIDIEIFTHIIKHAQISSLISKNLMSVRAMRSFQQDPTRLLSTVSEMNRQLENFRDSLPAYLRPGAPIKQSSEGLSLPRFIHVIYLHFAYYGSLMAAHILLFYPWISSRFITENSDAFRNQIAISSNTVAEAARNIILISRYIDVDVASPAWLAFYYPMVGVINLFIYILKYPSLPSAQSDVALVDVVAGHFGHMEFITSSELTFPFPREVSSLASRTVKRAREKSASNPNLGVQTTLDAGSSVDAAASSGIVGPMTGIENAAPLNEPDVFDNMDFDMESWNIFSSVSMEGFNGDADFFFAL